MSISASAITEAPIARQSGTEAVAPGKTPPKRTVVAAASDPLVPEPR
ncbi:MAG: hypothetical protein ABR588_02570 [Sphingomicrobium sp.]